MKQRSKTLFGLYIVFLLIPLTSSVMKEGVSENDRPARETHHAFTLLFTETFESDGEGSKYRTNGFDDGINDYWARTNTSPKAGSTNNSTFTAFTGSYYWTGEDVDATDNPLGTGEPAYMLLKTLNISAYAGGTARLSLDIGADQNHTGSWETDDRFAIEYAFDGNIATGANSVDGLPIVANVASGTYAEAATFWGAGSVGPTGDHLSLDTSVPTDGVGDNTSILTVALTGYSFDFDIPAGASNMSIRFFFNGATSETISFDQVTVSAEAGVSAPGSATVAAKVFLEGAYNGANLNTTLNASIPAAQPYSGSSYNNHAGTESGATPAGAVDWVLVELREAASAATALNSTKIGSAAGFLMSDGSIKAIDGSSNLTITLSGNSGADFYLVVYHRNHLPIMSANAISEGSSVYTIDFTGTSANTHQGTTGLASLSGGKFGMMAGDADGDGDVDTADLNAWRGQNGATFSYNSTNGDFNLDGVINAVDRNGFQKKNNAKTSQVPTT